MAHRSGAGQGDQKRFTKTAKRVKKENSHCYHAVNANIAENKWLTNGQPE